MLPCPCLSCGLYRPLPFQIQGRSIKRNPSPRSLTTNHQLDVSSSPTSHVEEIWQGNTHDEWCNSFFICFGGMHMKRFVPAEGYALVWFKKIVHHPSWSSCIVTSFRATSAGFASTSVLNQLCGCTTYARDTCQCPLHLSRTKPIL